VSRSHKLGSRLTSPRKSAKCAARHLFGHAGASADLAQLEVPTRSGSKIPALPEKISSSNSVTRIATLRLRSSLHAHTLPKRDAIFNLRSRRRRLRVTPSGIVIPHSAYFHVKIMRGSLPWAFTCVPTGLQELPAHRVLRKIVIPFYNHARVALRDHFATPDCLSHFLPSVRRGLRRSGARLRQPPFIGCSRTHFDHRIQRLC
jgi:hypothetical protein